MTDESCGCDSFPCRTDDRHDCGRSECGYTKYRKTPAPKAETAADAIDGIRGDLRGKFRRLTPEQRARVNAYADFVEQTAGLEWELREAKRREKHAEIFG